MQRPAAILTCVLASILARSTASAQARNQLDASPSLFSVLAAINAAGYDEGLNSPSTNPLRAQIRQWVINHKPASLGEIRKFYSDHRQREPERELNQYVTLALSLGPPPEFAPRFDSGQMPPEAAALSAFVPLLKRFHQEAQLDEAFRRAQPAFDAVIERYHGPVSETVLKANTYLRNPTSGIRGRNFAVVVDLLGAPNYALARLLGDDYFVVVTASAEPRTRDILHSYLDYAIDPLAIRYSALLDKKQALLEFAQQSPLLGDDYRSDFTRLAGMSLVYAVEARLESRAEGLETVEQAMREGFTLTGHFWEALPDYEKQETSFRLYFPKFFESIDLKRENQRAATIQFASKRAVRKVKAPPPPPEPKLSGVEARLSDAEALYMKRDLEAAATLFRQVMQESASDPQRAKAAYGLARVFALQKNPELSQLWFERTLELDPEPYERAWTHVYLARLAVAAKDPEAARTHYQAALAIAGSSEGARKAAQSELTAVSAASSSPQTP
jgi:tetratricopeptide (TPR) repeat protein